MIIYRCLADWFGYIIYTARNNIFWPRKTMMLYVSNFTLLVTPFVSSATQTSSMEDRLALSHLLKDWNSRCLSTSKIHSYNFTLLEFLLHSFAVPLHKSIVLTSEIHIFYIAHSQFLSLTSKILLQIFTNFYLTNSQILLWTFTVSTSHIHNSYFRN